MDSIKNRRTIRKYKSQDIPEDLLNGLLEDSSEPLQWEICSCTV